MMTYLSPAFLHSIPTLAGVPSLLLFCEGEDSSSLQIDLDPFTNQYSRLSEVQSQA